MAPLQSQYIPDNYITEKAEDKSESVKRRKVLLLEIQARPEYIVAFQGGILAAGAVCVQYPAFTGYSYFIACFTDPETEVGILPVHKDILVE